MAICVSGIVMKSLDYSSRFAHSFSAGSLTFQLYEDLKTQTRKIAQVKVN